MLIIHNAAQLVAVSQSGENVKHGLDMNQVAVIENGAVVVQGDRIKWIGHTKELASVPKSAELIDAAGKVVVPGFVDSHTHLIFAGAREAEFEQRLQGKSYQEIAALGGGINATLQRVRHSCNGELKELALPWFRRVLSLGVTAVEV